VPRSYAAAAVLPDGLLVLGGWDGTSGRRLDSTERYHLGTDRWRPAPPLASPRYGLAAVLV
jgi:hypothetical protein